MKGLTPPCSRTPQSLLAVPLTHRDAAAAEGERYVKRGTQFDPIDLRCSKLTEARCYAEYSLHQGCARHTCAPRSHPLSA
jgi:hypothetical protein